MRALTGHIWDVLNAGGPFVGPNGKPHGRVTVEAGWGLNTSSGAVGSVPTAKLPVRYFASTSTAPVETEVPNIKSVHMSRSVDNQASTCEVVVYNTSMASPPSGEVGNPGYLTFNRGTALNRWGHTTNAWEHILVPNALIRTYQGYGGTDKTITQALSDGNIILSGTWLVDEVRISTNGTIELRCRDMAKLLIDQKCYVPLIPATYYPRGLHYARFGDAWIVDTPVVDYGTNVGGVKKIIAGVVGSLFVDGSGAHDYGYWILGDDGGIFAYGTNHFSGSEAGYAPSHSTVDMARNTNGGYWLVNVHGAVTGFGEAGLGNGTGTTPFVAIESPYNVHGYYLMDNAGHVFSFGSAVYHGGTPVTPKPMVDMAAMPDGTGYWLTNENGQVYTYGAAAYHGGSPNNTGHKTVAIASTHTGLGYWLVDSGGNVYAFGDAPYFGGAGGLTLTDPICDMTIHPEGLGYWLFGEDGGVFTYGPPFYGSLRGGTETTFPTDGNYLDYTDIVKDLLLWSGFWLHPNTELDGSATVYGTIETTGAYALNPLPPEMFDKQSIIDIITKIRDVVGYAFWVDETGAPYFTLQNWWGPGNFLPDGSHTATIPTFDERVGLITYGVNHTDSTARSQVIISSTEPTSGLDGIITTTFVPPTAGRLRGMVRPAMWVNGFFTGAAEQAVMAILIGWQLYFLQRVGSVEVAGNPMLQIDDQVKILERQAEEQYIHYVRSIDSNMDLDAGTYRMTVTTHWLGDHDNWTITDPPSGEGRVP